MEGIYKLAGVNVMIRSIHKAVHTMCVGYAGDAPADLTVETTQADIDAERLRASRDDAQVSDAYLETLAVYRQIAERMPSFGVFLCHGSAISANGLGYIFCAPSGTGKSTHARLWRELLGSRAFMINDDKPLIRVTDEGALVYGTPWNGKHHLSRNTSAPLRAVCLLQRAEENRIQPIGALEAMPGLLRQIYRPEGTEAMERTLGLIDGLCRHVKLYRLGCNMDIEAAAIAYRAMKP